MNPKVDVALHVSLKVIQSTSGKDNGTLSFLSIRKHTNLMQLKLIQGICTRNKNRKYAKHPLDSKELD